MGKRGGSKPTAENLSVRGKQMTLREEALGKMQTKGGGTNLKSVLRHEHLKKLAVWASVRAEIPSLAAFLGNRLANDGEVAGIAPDPQLFSCQICETILQPGFNCIVRIEKVRTRKTRRKCKKPSFRSSQNNVIYTCHFCSHRNSMRGTPKFHMKEFFPSKPKPAKPMLKKRIKEPKIIVTGDLEDRNLGNIHSPLRLTTGDGGDPALTSEVATPGPTKLLDRETRKRNRSGSRNPTEPGSGSAANGTEKTAGATSKRKKKTWTSLKEIAENDSTVNFTNLKIPFLL